MRYRVYAGELADSGTRTAVTQGLSAAVVIPTGTVPVARDIEVSWLTISENLNWRLDRSAKVHDCLPPTACSTSSNILSGLSELNVLLGTQSTPELAELIPLSAVPYQKVNSGSPQPIKMLCMAFSHHI
jgi:hypothetical protein